MPSRNLNRLLRLIEKRTKAIDRVTQVNARYQPRIDKLSQARDTKTERARRVIGRTTILIKGGVLVLTGTELGQLRRKFPSIPELR